MRAWKSIQPSPILLLAHYTLQFYHLIKYLHKISTPPSQRESEQKNEAGNALGQNVMTVRQKDTAKIDVMTATENIMMRGIVDDPQGPARTILIAQM